MCRVRPSLTIRAYRASLVHVRHGPRTAGVFRSKLSQIEIGRAYEVVHLAVQVTTARNMVPHRGEPVLPALDAGLG